MENSDQIGEMIPGLELEKMRVREYLIRTGQMERLKGLVERRLSASGWKMEMVNLLREKVKAEDSNINFEMLYNAIKDKGKIAVPPAVEEVCVNRIKEIYKSQNGLSD